MTRRRMAQPTTWDRPSLLLGDQRRGRYGLRLELLAWQLASLLLVITVLGGATLLFSENYLLVQLRQIHQQQAKALFDGSDFVEAVQQDQASNGAAPLSDWMERWRHSANASFIAYWNLQGAATFDADQPEVASAVIAQSGAPLLKEGEGLLTIGTQRFYWQAARLYGGQRYAGLGAVLIAKPLGAIAGHLALTVALAAAGGAWRTGGQLFTVAAPAPNHP